MRSFKMTRFGSPLCEAVEPVPEPAGTQVLVKVKARGVCHSDLHILDRYFDLGHGRKMDLTRGIQLPKTPGHEIAGVVAAVDPRDPDTREQFIKQADGFASVIDFAGGEATAEFGLSVLRKGGKMVLVGLFGGALELPLPTVRGISMIGSYGGSLAEL